LKFGGKMIKKSILIITIFIVAAVGCAGPRSFVNPDTDWGFYQKIGVLPFVNLTSDRFAGEKVQSAFITELFISGKFEVVEPGEFNKKAIEILKASGAQSGQELSIDMIKNVGEKTQVQGVIEGIVKEYTTIRVGQADYPLISLDLRMIDVPTGTVIWMSSFTMKGGPKFPIVSIGETHTLGELSQKICKKIVSNFVGKAY